MKMFKTAMKKLALAVSLTLAVTSAFAGETTPQRVLISFFQNTLPSAFEASGSIVAARAAANSQEYIGCTLGSVPTQVSCFARTKANATLSCISLNPSEALLDAVARINTSSYVTFDTVKSGRECLFIVVNNGSSYL